MGVQRENLRKSDKPWDETKHKMTQQIKEYESPFCGPWELQEVRGIPYSYHQMPKHIVPMINTKEDPMKAWKKKYRWDKKKNMWIKKR